MMHDADERLERLIDRAASSLTDVEAPPAFVARVMAAIETPPHRTASPLSLAAPLAGCAVLLFALGAGWILRQQGRGEAQVVESRALPTAALRVPSSAPVARVGGVTAAEAPREATRRAGRRAERTSRRVPTFDAIAIEHVDIEPVVAGDDGLAPLAVGPLFPIVVDELAIEPIDLSRQPRSDTPQSPGGRR